MGPRVVCLGGGVVVGIVMDGGVVARGVMRAVTRGG